MFVWLFILGGGWLAFKLLTGSSLVGALKGPQIIVNERLQLKDGDATGYGFTLPTSRRVEVEVSANPKNVNVMLMSEPEWTNYQRVKGNLFGGQFEYRQALSRQGIMTWRGSEVLPNGSWRVVVERPREALLLRDSTNAMVKIVGY